MRKIARWSVDNRVPVNLLMVIMLVGGVFAFNTIHREVFPLFMMRMVIVSTLYPGVAPAELEELVTIPIENAVAEVDHVKEIRSSTTEGLSSVIIELEEYVDNVAVVAQDIESAVDAITNFPLDAEEPVVEDIKMEWPVIDVAVAGIASEEERRDAAKLMKRRLERLPGVSSVVATGLREKEIWAELDPSRLYALNLSLDLVLGRLRQRLVNVPAGSLRTEQGEVLLRTSGTTADAERLESVVIRTAEDGHHIRLSDLGSVIATFEEATTLARANGSPSINLHVVKQQTGDTIQIVEGVKALVAELQPAVADGVEFHLFNDGSIWISNRLNIMYQSGLWGLALVLLVLNVFLNPRVAAMTAFGLPLAVSGGLFTLYVTGGSLNMLSLFAFILVLGILVDDAIIIAENCYRYMQRGHEPHEATIIGTGEVTLPVIAGVATTIAAFLPLLLTSGMMGEFLKIIPIVAVACLVASLIEALIVLPSHIADFSRSVAQAPERRQTARWFRRLRRTYGSLMVAAVRHRYATLGLILFLAAGAGVLATFTSFIFMDNSDSEEFRINIEAPSSSALEDTEQIVAQAETVALQFPTDEVESVIGLIGRRDVDRERVEYGPHVGQVIVRLAAEQYRGRDGNSIFNDLREGLQGLVGAESVELARRGHGPSVGRAVYVQVLGPDPDRLLALVDEIKGYLAGIPGVYDITDSFIEGKDEIRIETDEARAGLYDLSVDSIGRTVRTAMDGTVVAIVQEGDEEIDVRVIYLPEYRRTVDDIGSLRIPTSTGELIPFGNVAGLSRTTGYARIDREARERVISVAADVDNAVITSIEANGLIARDFANLGDRYPGYYLDFGGEGQEIQEGLTSLFQAFIVAILVIYAILGAIFKSFTQPFVVLFAIPFSLIGVVVGFFLLDKPLTFMALFGVIALGGIVVNDSLLLVHFINQARRRGISTPHAVAISTKRRFRPVILTSLTTMVGVLPLMVTSSEQASWLSPMATAIVSGLGVSTAMTLLLVPALYLINEDMHRGLRWLFGLGAADETAVPEHPDVEATLGAPVSRT